MSFDRPMSRISSVFVVAVAVLISSSTTALAVPVLYDLHFDGSSLGGAGRGSVAFDAETGVISNFSWVFDNGTYGGLKDDVMTWSGFNVWDILSDENLTGKGCGIATSCGVGIYVDDPEDPGSLAYYGTDLSTVDFSRRDPGLATYTFLRRTEVPLLQCGGRGQPPCEEAVNVGRVSATPVSVPEPSSAWLMLFGVALLIGARTRRAKALSS